MHDFSGKSFPVKVLNDLDLSLQSEICGSNSFCEFACYYLLYSNQATSSKNKCSDCPDFNFDFM